MLHNKNHDFVVTIKEVFIMEVDSSTPIVARNLIRNYPVILRLALLAQDDRGQIAELILGEMM